MCTFNFSCFIVIISVIFTEKIRTHKKNRRRKKSYKYLFDKNMLLKNIGSGLIDVYIFGSPCTYKKNHSNKTCIKCIPNNAEKKNTNNHDLHWK